MSATLRITLTFVVLVLLLGAEAGPAAARGVDWRPDTPYALHSMVYTSSPYGFKRAMFSEAAAAHASSIRLDVEVNGTFIKVWGAVAPDWRQVDEVVALSRRYGIRVDAVITGTPWWMASCRPGTPDDRLRFCPPVDQVEYARMVGAIAARTRGTIDTFEILNEPDGAWSYSGTAQDYAATLTRCHDAIKQASPAARVLIGGVRGTSSIPWLADMLATPGLAVERKFDVANVHVRGTLAGVRGQVTRWKRFFASFGIDRPLWVTEHGYPSDPAFQRDRAYRNGESSQAAYLVASTQAMLAAGVDKVFVTERDNLQGEFASEGIIGGTVLDPPIARPAIRRKPAFDAFRGLSAGNRGERP